MVDSHHVTGNYDYLLQVEVADLPAYEDFHANQLAELPGVATVTSYVTMKTLSAGTAPAVRPVDGRVAARAPTRPRPEVGGQTVMVPRMQTVTAPLTQTVPSASAVISMLAARPSLAPWETR